MIKIQKKIGIVSFFLSFYFATFAKKIWYRMKEGLKKKLMKFISKSDCKFLSFILQHSQNKILYHMKEGLNKKLMQFISKSDYSNSL